MMSLATWPMAQLSITPLTPSSRLPTDGSQLASPLAVKPTVLAPLTLQLTARRPCRSREP